MVNIIVSEGLQVLLTYSYGVHDPVNIVINFLFLTIWPRLLTLLLGFLTGRLAVSFFSIYFLVVTLTVASVAFHLIRNSDHVASVCIDFIFSWMGDAPFHCTAFDYSYAGWDDFYDHIIEGSWKHSFHLCAFAFPSE